MKLWPFNVVNESDKPVIEVDYQGKTRRFKPEEISAMVLTKMKETAGNYSKQTKLYLKLFNQFFVFILLLP